MSERLNGRSESTFRKRVSFSEVCTIIGVAKPTALRIINAEIDRNPRFKIETIGGKILPKDARRIHKLIVEARDRGDIQPQKLS